MKEKLAILHRVSRCPSCGYPGYANEKGRMMCCDVRESDMKSEFKERRSITRKEKVNQVTGSSEGALYGPLFEQGKDKV